MSENPDLAARPRVSCAVCLKEVPQSAALSANDEDDVLFFCGVDCYEEWSAEQIKEKTQEAGEP